jgi:hypothetical protein
MAVEEGELLLAVGRILGGIEVDRDAASASPPALALSLDHNVRDGFGHAKEALGVDGVLEPRERGLGGERIAVQRIAIEQELVNGIVREPSAVVGVGVAARQREEPLAHQLLDRVLDLARLAPIDEAGGKSGREAELLVDRLEQHGPAVGAAVRGIEARDDRLPKPLKCERQLRYTVCRHRAVSVGCCEPRLDTAIHSTLERAGGTLPSCFVNFPG